MNAVAFDTHAYIKKMVAVGFTEVQAEVQSQALTDLVVGQLATKEDLAREIETLRVEIKAVEYRLTIRMGGMLAAAVGVVTVLVKLL